MKGKKIKLGCMTMAAVMLFGGCSLFPEEEELRKAPIVSTMEEDYFRTAEVKTGDVVEKLNFYSTYRKKKSASYSFAKVDRDTFLEEIYVKQGETVKAGTVLAQLSLGSLEEEITAAQEAYDNYASSIEYTSTMLEFERERKKVAKDYGKKYEEEYLKSLEDKLERLEDSMYIAELKLNEVKDKLKERQLVAEFDGVVTFVKKFDGWHWLRAGEELVKVESEGFGFVLSTDMDEVFNLGREVTITTENGIYDAKVEEVAELDKNRSSVILDVINPNELLVENMRGQISFEVNSARNVTYVPYGALRVMGDQYAVYVLNKDGMREMRYIEVGMIIKGSIEPGENRVEVKSGVNPGEVVIVR